LAEPKPNDLLTLRADEPGAQLAPETALVWIVPHKSAAPSIYSQSAVPYNI